MGFHQDRAKYMVVITHSGTFIPTD